MRRSPSIASSLPDDVEVYLVLETTSERDWAVPGARLKKSAPTWRPSTIWGSMKWTPELGPGIGEVKV